MTEPTLETECARALREAFSRALAHGTDVLEANFVYGLRERARRIIDAIATEFERRAALSASPPSGEREGVQPLDIAYMRGKDEGYARGLEDAAEKCEAEAAGYGTDSSDQTTLLLAVKKIRALLPKVTP